jgi:hypothetical protein
MKSSLGIALFIVIALASCSKKPTTRIKVKVANTYSAYLHLTPCIPDAREPVVINEMGRGNTAACPAGDVEIVVIKPTRTFNIESKDVRVHKQSDGSPLAITAEIP